MSVKTKSNPATEAAPQAEATAGSIAKPEAINPLQSEVDSLKAKIVALEEKIANRRINLPSSEDFQRTVRVSDLERALHSFASVEGQVAKSVSQFAEREFQNGNGRQSKEWNGKRKPSIDASVVSRMVKAGMLPLKDPNKFLSTVKAVNAFVDGCDGLMKA